VAVNPSLLFSSLLSFFLFLSFLKTNSLTHGKCCFHQSGNSKMQLHNATLPTTACYIFITHFRYCDFKIYWLWCKMKHNRESCSKMTIWIGWAQMPVKIALGSK
jgi:hypothetical protein